MHSLFEILQFDFILRNALYASALLGAFVPLLGVHLVIGRRTILALALPQVSTLGVALTLWLATLCGLSLNDESGRGLFLTLALTGALIAMALAILAEQFTTHRLNVPADAESGSLYAVAAAGIFAIAASRAVPELGLLEVLRGDVLAVPTPMLLCNAAGFALIGTILFLLRRPLHTVLFDPASAAAAGLPAGALAFLATALVCLTIALGGLAAGPLTIFALLVLPVAAWLPWTKSLSQLYLAAGLTGSLCAFAGFWISYAQEDWNLPIPAAQIALLGAVWALLRLTALIVRQSRRTPGRTLGATPS